MTGDPIFISKFRRKRIFDEAQQDVNEKLSCATYLVLSIYFELAGGILIPLYQSEGTSRAAE